MTLFPKVITVAARDSNLSRAQVEEVLLAVHKVFPDVVFQPLWIKTTGDLDQKTSLLTQEKSDFFTKEVDEAVLDKRCQIAIHSAKDLPDPMHPDLVVIAYTEGVDSSDVLVFREGDSLSSLPLGARVGTSSLRRVENLRNLRADLNCVDIRGTIEKRLSLLDEGVFDAVVIAKAALIRLKLFRAVQNVPGAVSPMQGRLAILCRKEEMELKALFSFLHKDVSLIPLAVSDEIASLSKK